MIAAGLYPHLRNRPERRIEIKLAPPRADHFAGPSGRQDCELKCSRRNAVGLAQGCRERRNLVEGHSGMVASGKLIGPGKQVIEMAAPARRVLSRPEPLRLRGVQHPLNATTNPRGGLLLLAPYRLERIEHVVGANFV